MRGLRFLPFLLILPVASAPLVGNPQQNVPQAPSPQARIAAVAEELDGLFYDLRHSETREEASKAEAEIYIRLTVSQSPTVNLLMESATVALSQQNDARARAILEDVVAIDGDFAEGLTRAASLAYQDGDLPRAEALLRRAVALEPRHFAAWAGLGLVLEDQDDLDGAGKAYNEALYFHPFLDVAKRGQIRIEAKTTGLSL